MKAFKELPQRRAKCAHLCATPLLILLAATSAWAAAGDCRLVAGWQPGGPARTFGPENLFEYLDGGAEGYLIFGFVRLVHQTCTKGEDSLVLDVSEMNDAEAAYGLFAVRCDPHQPLQPIGMAGQILPTRASFAKGNYYVEMTATPGEDYRPELRDLLTGLEKRIQGRSAPPEALAWFPAEGRNSVRLIPESVLGLQPLKRGYVAEYSNGQAFIVTETTAQSAAAVLAVLRQRFGGATFAEVADEAFQANDRYLGGVCVFRKGHYLGGYAHLRETTEAVSLARTLASRLP
jgi:hypothetical protein